MVALNRTELDGLVAKLQSLETFADELPVKSVTIETGQIEDDIQDVRVFVTIDLDEYADWPTESARTLRDGVEATVSAYLAQRHDESAFAVTTFLRPRDADSSPDA